MVNKKYAFIALLALASTAFASSYVLDPNKNFVDHVHYDASLKLIVIHVHAKIFWFTLDERYGLKVEDDVDINKHLLRILGPEPTIVHLKEIDDGNNIKN